MNDALERVARAIAHGHGAQMVVHRTGEGSLTVAACHGYGSFGHSAEAYARDHWREYAGAAVSALNAIREPTPAMLSHGEMAGWSGVIEGCAEAEREAAASLWQAMIDEVLR